MRFVFDIGLWYGPNDTEHRTIAIDDPLITDWFMALDEIISWQMDIGRRLNRDKQAPNTWPSIFRRPKNITSFQLMEDSSG